MFMEVPGFMESEKLRKEIGYIKEKTFDDKGHFIRPLTNEELEDIDKP